MCIKTKSELDNYFLEEFNKSGVKLRKYYVKPNFIKMVKYNKKTSYLSVLTKKSRYFNFKLKSISFNVDVNKSVICR